MSNARTLASTINSSSQIVVPSGGVNFGTSTDGSGTVTGGILDDYEEGTFTPEVYDANSGGNQLTSNVNYGAYTKIGNLVTIHFNFYNIDTSGATATYTLYFRNLPFTAKSISNQGIGTGAVICDKIITGGGFLSAISAPSTNYATIRKMGDNTIDSLLKVQDIGISGTSDIAFSLTYRVV
jgi:hypothetical protein